MFLKLLVIFIIVPLIELMIIIEVSSRIGLFATLMLLLVISICGAALAKREGYNVVTRIQKEVGEGRMPGDSLIDGALVLTGAILLLTPGYLTDAVALLLLLPPVRKLVRSYARKRLERAIANRTVGTYQAPGWGNGQANSDEPEQRRRELEE